MKKCSECGEKISIMTSHYHPISGKDKLVCSKCYNYIKQGLEFYNKCLSHGRENHKKECYFWDKTKKKCKNEKFFKKLKKEKINLKN